MSEVDLDLVRTPIDPVIHTINQVFLMESGISCDPDTIFFNELRRLGSIRRLQETRERKGVFVDKGSVDTVVVDTSEDLRFRERRLRIIREDENKE